MGEGGGENSPFPLLLKWESEALFLCLKLEKQSRSISPPHTQAATAVGTLAGGKFSVWCLLACGVVMGW